MKDRVLIFGAAGFIGRALRLLLRDRFELLSVDIRAFEPIEDASEHVFQTDLGDRSQVDTLFAALSEHAESIRAVVHLAAYYDFANLEDPRYTRLEEELPHVLERIDQHVPTEAPLIYASSMAALAPTTPGVALGPDAPRAGLWAYPQHKLTSERVLENHRGERSLVELVLAGVYSDAGELVPLHQQIKRIASRSIEALFYPGPVDRGLTYVHIDDTTDAFARTIKAFSGTRGKNARLMIGEAQPVTYRAIHVAASAILLGHRLPLLRVPRAVAWLGATMLFFIARVLGSRRFVRPWMVRFAGEHFELDIDPTRKQLGWEPQHRMIDVLTEKILPLARDERAVYNARNEARPW